MPYASFLVSCSVVECSSAVSAFLVAQVLCLSFLGELCLCEVVGFCSLFYLLHSHDVPWDSPSRLMHSGIACLASQAPDWAVVF